jgi:hypothetical protein
MSAEQTQGDVAAWGIYELTMPSYWLAYVIFVALQGSFIQLSSL